MDNITPKAIGDALGIHYRKALALLAAGTIKAKKSQGTKGRWVIAATDFEAFKLANDAAIAALKEKYISLYRGGCYHKTPYRAHAGRLCQSGYCPQ